MSIMRTSFDAVLFLKANQRIRGIAQSGSAPALGAGCREFESLALDDFLIYGGRSSVGRAQDCDSCGRGFNPHRPPHIKKAVAAVAIAFFLTFPGSTLS